MPILTAEERIGTKLAGKYRLDRILGRGGFGVVYAGVHELTGREIATKVLKHELSEQEQFVKRFLHEAQAAAGLNHPNVVDVLDLGQDPDGTVFIVLELLTGQDLSSVIEQRGVLTVQETLAYVLPVMDALAKAHEQGIVHRDLKPDNIFLNVNSKGEMIPKLLDFGIAKMGDSKGVTSTGMIVGTPHYMSPEQVRGSKQIGAAADVWSMGVVLWQCLAGGVPFDSDSPTGILGAILTTRAPSVAERNPNLPPHIIAAIDGALVHEAEHRIPNMGALITALQGDGSQMVVAPGHSIRVDTGPMSAPRPTPPTVNLAMTPIPGGTPLPGMTPLPGGMTPIPGIMPPGAMHTPASYTPAGYMVEPPKSKTGLVVGGALAALLVVGIGVVGAIAIWPTDEAAASPEASAPAPEPTTVAGAEPTPEAETPEPPTEPSAVVEAPEPVVEEPVAEAPVEEAPAEEAPAEEAPAQIAEARPHHRTRNRPVPQPQVRSLAPAPPPVTRPVRPTTNPTVGNRGAPILR